MTSSLRSYQKNLPGSKHRPDTGRLLEIDGHPSIISQSRSSTASTSSSSYSWGAKRRTVGWTILREQEGGQWVATTRTAAARIPQPAWAAVAESVTRRMEGVAGAGRVPRYFSDSTGRVLSEEERAAENVYIQKMEREKLEKLRKKADKDKVDAAMRAAAGKGDKKGEEAHPS